MTKPAVDKIEGIPPAIAIEQKVNTRNPRSTVGTNTEIYDYMRLLFAKIGRTYSPISGQEVKRECVQDVITYITNLVAKENCNNNESGKVVYVLAPFEWLNSTDKIEKLLSIKDEGYGRMFSNGQVLRVDNIIKDIAQYSNVEVYILIDRFIMPTDNSKFANDDITRMQDSVQTAFNEGNGHLKVAVVGAEQTYKDFSNIFEADGMRFEEPTELMFSYNNPIGACPVCGGYGSMVGIDEGLVIPNSSLSVYEGAIACWRGETMSNYLKEFIAVSN
ncbi:MAG: excinuclease ABC subunit A, partial [Bacteroidales bacterium]